MRKPIAALMISILASIFISSNAQAQVSADDFLPVVQGGSSEVESPEEVAIKDDVVSAETAQDAINAAVDVNEKELANGDTLEVGAKMVKFGSGIGFVATGAGTYRTMANPVATRISKRKAYVVAFTAAKKNLAEQLNGLTNESQEEIRQSLVNINLPDDEMTNISEDTRESIKQAVDMLLRGFVVHEVDDNDETGVVHVSIVTTPKTRGQLARPAPGAIEVDTLRDGITQVLSEVRTGIVPPVGGRIIMVKATGETAFVGFGSSVVRTSENAAAQAKLNLAAQKIAKARASDSLCGVIIGDRTTWEGTFEDTTKDSVQEFVEFETAIEGDPIATKNATETKKLDTAYDTFVSRVRTDEVFTSARRGVLPPGLQAKTWFDDDKSWAYGLVIYIPSATNAAASTAREIAEATLIQVIDDGSKKGSVASGGKASGTPKVATPGKDVKKGPSGKISNDDDL